MKWKAIINSNIEVVEWKTKGGLVWYLTSPKLPMFLPCCYYYCTPLYWWNALNWLFFHFTLHMDWVCYWKSNFQWEWKGIGYCFGFALLHPAIGFIAHKKKVILITFEIPTLFLSQHPWWPIEVCGIPLAQSLADSAVLWSSPLDFFQAHHGP